MAGFDRFDLINGVLCGIYQVAKELAHKSVNKQDDSANKQDDSDIVLKNGTERFLTSTDIEIVLDFVHRKMRGVKCDYILHLLLWTLKDEDFSEILRKMSSENVVRLKDAILVAKEYKCPRKFTDEQIDDIKKAEYPERELRRRTVLPENRKDTTAKRYAALVTNKVVECWSEAVPQMDKWLDAIEEYEKNPPVMISQSGNSQIVVSSGVVQKPTIPQVVKEKYSLEELPKYLDIPLITCV